MVAPRLRVLPLIILTAGGMHHQATQRVARAYRRQTSPTPQPQPIILIIRITIITGNAVKHKQFLQY